MKFKFTSEAEHKEEGTFKARLIGVEKRKSKKGNHYLATTFQVDGFGLQYVNFADTPMGVGLFEDFVRACGWSPVPSGDYDMDAFMKTDVMVEITHQKEDDRYFEVKSFFAIDKDEDDYGDEDEELEDDDDYEDDEDDEEDEDE